MKKINKGRSKGTFDKDTQYSPYSIKNDLFDRQTFEKIVEENQKIHDHLYNDLPGDYKLYPELLQDTFSALFKFNPEHLKSFEMIPKYLLNHSIMNEIQESPKYKELRAHTKLDKINSTVGTEILSEELKNILKNAQEQQQALEDMLQAQKDLEAAQKNQQKDSEDGDKDSDEKTPGQPSQKLTLEQAKKMLEEARKNYEASTNKEEFKQKIHGAIKQAQETVHETSEFITQWGLGNDPNYMSMPHTEKMALLRRLRESSKLKEIAMLAGKYKPLAMQREQQKIQRGSNEIYDVKTGTHLQKTLPSEKMMLQHPQGKTLFFKKLIEGQLLEYDTRDKVKQVKGPIIFCVDESGSMYGEKEIWSKAVGLALLEIAIKQKRDFAYVHFSGQWKPEELRVDYFPKEEPYNIEKVISACEYFDGGGTNFEPPLEKSMQIIEQHEAFSKADIIFVTDGECAISDQFRDRFKKFLKQNNTTIYTVLTDVYGSTTISIEEFTEPRNVFKLSNLTDDAKEGIATILFDMV